MTAAAQRVDGAIGVSLTIVAPRPARTMELIGVRIDRDGMATIRTTSAAPRITGIVMARVSGADVLDAGGHGHALPCESLRDECERKMECRVDVGRPDAGVARDVRLRMELLVVAGT